MTEFLLVAAALVLALLTPLPQGESVAGLLLDALLGSYRAQAYLLAIL